jgi:hypothetical protein
VAGIRKGNKYMVDKLVYPDAFGQSHPYAFSISHWLHFEGFDHDLNLFHSGEPDTPSGNKRVDIKVLSPQQLQENNNQSYQNLSFDVAAAISGGVGSALGELLRKIVPAQAQVEALLLGTVKNPREQQHFESPKFRAYNFAWELAPTSQYEVGLIKDMANLFRRWSYPEIVTGTDTYATTYKPPLVWKVRHIGSEGGGTPKELSSYGKMGLAVITDVNLNYQSSGVHAQMRGGNPAFMNLTINMTELKLQHRNFFSDYTGAGGYST